MRVINSCAWLRLCLDADGKGKASGWTMEQDGGFADDVAVELVVILPVDLIRTAFPMCWSTWSSFLARRVMSRRRDLAQCRNRRGRRCRDQEDHHLGWRRVSR